MSLQRFTREAVSEWMKGEGPEADIVLSSRIRLARNLTGIPFPMFASDEQVHEVLEEVEEAFGGEGGEDWQSYTLLPLSDMNELEKMVLVEKHLISPNLANESRHGAVFLSSDESVSIMVNEEDHLRIQCLFPGLQLKEAWTLADRIDDFLEGQLTYAFDERRGYLTNCPTNVGTGIRASVMVHLPALVLTQQINRLLAAINQVGLAVRGLYGEGSEAMGNLFQVSNQVTLGQSEEEIIDNLENVVRQIVAHERAAREKLLQESKIRVVDRVQRSLGILTHAAIIDSKEASQRLSDIRLGLDLGLIEHVQTSTLNELMVMTQPGFLQQSAGENLSGGERDIRRAELIRGKLTASSGT